LQILHEKVHDTVVERLKKAYAQLRIGDPLEGRLIGDPLEGRLIGDPLEGRLIGDPLEGRLICDPLEGRLSVTRWKVGSFSTHSVFI
jgi:hypothetical protein